MDVLINGDVYIKKPETIKPPKNNIGATHWAFLPDDTFIFYKINTETLIWLSISELWTVVSSAPYTLYCFDDYT